MGVINFFGGRVVKTGVAVFLTALICFSLNWPPVFAVITAIVTLEPTVSDSIKKGIVRFPASVIGSGYAVILIALFGNSSITYTLAAVLTIATCYKLRLHAGLLVATLTAVTMVEVIDSNYLLAFLTRLGTTSIGLLVSTGVNMFVLPPDYREDIFDSVERVRLNIIASFQQTFENIFAHERITDATFMNNIIQIRHQIRKAEQLIRFQHDESKYHPLVGKEKRQFLKVEEELSLLRTFHYHLDNLNQLDDYEIEWSAEEQEQIGNSVNRLIASMQTKSKFEINSERDELDKLAKLLLEQNKLINQTNNKKRIFFSPKLIILYELISIYSVVNKLSEVSTEN